MRNIFSVSLTKPLNKPTGNRNMDLSESYRDSINPFVWNEKGNIHFKNQDFENAIASYHKAIQLDSGFGQPFSNLALVHFIRGEYRQSIQMYQKSIRLLTIDREKAIAWNCLGNVYRCMKDYDSARTAYQNASELDQTNGGVYDAITILEIGEKNKNSEFWNDLGKLFFKASDYEKAASAFTEAIRLEPSSGYSYSYLARVLSAQGRYREAISLYRKSINLISEETEIANVWNRLGDLYRKLNDYDNAFEAYQNAMTLKNDKFNLLNRTRLSLLSNCATK